jgi:hypothetical protein
MSVRGQKAKCSRRELFSALASEADMPDLDGRLGGTGDYPTRTAHQMTAKRNATTGGPRWQPAGSFKRQATTHGTGEYRPQQIHEARAADYSVLKTTRPQRLTPPAMRQSKNKSPAEMGSDQPCLFQFS